MKLKFCLIVGLLLLTSSYTKADELISIYLNNSDLSPVRIEVSTISTIKFKTTKLVVTNHDNISNDFYFQCNLDFHFFQVVGKKICTQYDLLCSCYFRGVLCNARVFGRRHKRPFWRSSIEWS